MKLPQEAEQTDIVGKKLFFFSVKMLTFIMIKMITRNSSVMS